MLGLAVLIPREAVCLCACQSTRPSRWPVRSFDVGQFVISFRAPKGADENDCATIGPVDSIPLGDLDDRHILVASAGFWVEPNSRFRSDASHAISTFIESITLRNGSSVLVPIDCAPSSNVD